MPRKASPSPLGAVQPACGSCAYWKREDGQTYGDCHANPPTVYYDAEADCTQALRPTTEAADPPCRHWKPRN